MNRKQLYVLGALVFLAGSFFARSVGARPLRVSSENPRYFEDGNGKEVYLAGWNHGRELQDNAWKDYNNRPTITDYSGYINILRQKNLNYMRMWVSDHARFGVLDTVSTDPMPWSRSGSGTANDGQSKFNLDQFNQRYFDRLRSRIIEAQNHGIYVGIMLFQGWSLEERGDGDPWPWHPFNQANNINGINGDPNGDGRGLEVETLSISEITALQEKYVRKVIDTVNDLDNVLYEISNEGANIGWQYYFINFIKNYQSGKSKQHPVGMSSPYFTANQELFASNANWIGVGAVSWGNAGEIYISNPPVSNGSKVIMADSDHITGSDLVANNQDVAINWIWKNFMRGNNTSQLSGLVSSLGGLPEDETKDYTNFELVRNTMGYTRDYSEKMNLAFATPRGDLTSTTYALANPGSEYLIFAPNGGSFTVDLNSGSYAFEWFNPANGSVSQTGSITSSDGSKSFTAPFSGSAVLYLKSGGQQNVPSNCANLWNSSLSVPSSFGAAFNLFSGLSELLMSVACSSGSTANVTVGNSSLPVHL